MLRKLISHKNLVMFFAGLFVVSFLGNIFLYRELSKSYLNLYQVSLNPLGISKYRNKQESDSVGKTRVVFYGDSRAFKWKPPQTDRFQYINRGINGQTSAQVLWRFDADITELNPQIIVLQVGINDLRMLPTSPKTRKDLVQDCQNNIAQIIDRAHQINANIIVTTIFPLGQGNVSFQSRPFFPSVSEMEQSIKEVNEYIRTLNDKIIVFDTYSLLNQEDKNKVKYYKDLLHINRKGYELLNQKLKRILDDMSTES